MLFRIRRLRLTFQLIVKSKISKPKTVRHVETIDISRVSTKSPWRIFSLVVTCLEKRAMAKRWNRGMSVWRSFRFEKCRRGRKTKGTQNDRQPGGWTDFIGRSPAARALRACPTSRFFFMVAYAASIAA